MLKYKKKGSFTPIISEASALMLRMDVMDLQLCYAHRMTPTTSVSISSDAWNGSGVHFPAQHYTELYILFNVHAWNGLIKSMSQRLDLANSDRFSFSKKLELCDCFFFLPKQLPLIFRTTHISQDIHRHLSQKPLFLLSARCLIFSIRNNE